ACGFLLVLGGRPSGPHRNDGCCAVRRGARCGAERGARCAACAERGALRGACALLGTSDRGGHGSCSSSSEAVWRSVTSSSMYPARAAAMIPPHFSRPAATAIV